MARMKALLLLVALVALVPGCCCPEQRTPSPNLCHAHPEQPFDLTKKHAGPPGAGLVFGTADFQDGGAVLVKVQVEDLGSIPGDTATVTVWSGNGNAPQTPTIPPAGGTLLYQSTGDVPLRHYTTHLNGTYDPAIDKYWLVACVNHNRGDGTRDKRVLVYPWQPSTTPVPDSPRDFQQL